MPIPEDRLYNPERLNRWFAVSSLVMTASLLWLVWIDYDRPWREVQHDYFLGKAALAHLDYLDATRADRVREIDVAKQRVQDAKELVERTHGSKREALEKEQIEAGLKFNVANGEWSRKSQLLDVTKDSYERALSLHGADHPTTKAVHETLVADDEEVDRLRKDKEKWEDAGHRIQSELKEINTEIRVAEKRVRDLQSVAEDALAKDQQYRGVLSDTGLLGGIPVVGSFINAPILDFAAPKTAPGHEQVKQLVLPDIRQRLNYLESYTTDRCITCHVAIDDPQFSKDSLARKLERSLPGLNEALQRTGGQPFDPPAPPVPDGEAEALPVGQVTEYWGRLSKAQQDAYFDSMLEIVNQYLKQTGRKTIKLGQPLLAHPDLDLYLDVNSPHPMAKMGCTVCHEGNPQETDFVQAAHSPATHAVKEEWADEYYTTILGMPNITFETIQHFWDRPMRLPQYTEAGCAKCHSEITDVARFDREHIGERINLGRYLFTTVGCVNCHDVSSLPNERRVGPDLTYVGSKLKPEFVQEWVFFPQKFRPSTRMPHFFGQENNVVGGAKSLDPEPVMRTETEVAAISKYLFTVSDPWTPIEKPEGVDGDAERGRTLFTSLGCLACHPNLAEYGEAWITADLQSRDKIDAETAKHRYLGMTYEQRVHYAMEHFGGDVDTFLDPEAVRFEPDKPHNRPIFSRYAPELSGIGSKVSADWLHSWLMEPTQYSPETRMPSLRLSPAEAADLTAYLMTLTNKDFRQGQFELDADRRQMADKIILTLLSAQRSEARSHAIMKDEGGELTDMLVTLLTSSMGRDRAYDLIRPMDVDEKKLMFLGNKMIAHYGCYTCHKIRGFEKTTPVGTDLSNWAEKPIAQLDFAFFNDAFDDMRKERDDVFGYIYPQDEASRELRHFSPLPEAAREQITHTHAAFAKHKLLNPRIWDREKLKKPYDKLKMGNFYFTEREAEALTTFLLSRMPPRVNDNMKIDYAGSELGPIAAGRNLTRELNCIACHEIEDNAPTVQQYFRRTVAGKLEFEQINAPPLLWGEGAKVQHNWFHKFLQQVEPLRPWLQIRMPSFTLTGDQATTIAQYFAALARQDAKQLTKARTPVDEYRVAEAAKRKAEAEEADSESVLGADWYEKDSLERYTDRLAGWAIDRKLMKAAELDPLKSPPGRLRKAHAELLDRVDFMRDLYNVEYPFVEPPRPMSSAERFETGARFFDDMGCLGCHVFGNMLPGPAKTTDDFVQVYRLDGVRGAGDAAEVFLNGAPHRIGDVIDGIKLVAAENIVRDYGDVETKAFFEGSNAAGEPERIMLQAASAPNLLLTYQRLRRAWVLDWMLNPQWITPGTKMPQNFAGGVSPFAGDPNYPGTGVDHINLLVDYLYQAGAVNARVPLKKIVVQEKQEEFDEEGGAKKEEEFDD